MAARVVYLVATGQVKAEQIIGLTFTKKAAAALGQRVRRRLRMLGTVDDQLSLGQAVAGVGDPEVATYHAFGGRLIADFGPLAGVEPASRVLTPTGAWQLARHVVGRWDGDLQTDLGPDQVTERLLAISGALGRPPDRCRRAGGCAGRPAPPAAVGAAVAAAAGSAAQCVGRPRQTAAGPAMDPAAGAGFRGGKARAWRHRFRRPDADRRDAGPGAPPDRCDPAGEVPGGAAGRVPGHRPRPARDPADPVRVGLRRRRPATRSPRSATRFNPFTPGGARRPPTFRGSPPIFRSPMARPRRPGRC